MSRRSLVKLGKLNRVRKLPKRTNLSQKDRQTLIAIMFEDVYTDFDFEKYQYVVDGYGESELALLNDGWERLANVTDAALDITLYRRLK